MIVLEVAKGDYRKEIEIDKLSEQQGLLTPVLVLLKGNDCLVQIGRLILVPWLQLLSSFMHHKCQTQLSYSTPRSHADLDYGHLNHVDQLTEIYLFVFLETSYNAELEAAMEGIRFQGFPILTGIEITGNTIGCGMEVRLNVNSKKIKTLSTKVCEMRIVYFVIHDNHSVIRVCIYP